MISNLTLEDHPHLLALDLGLRFGWACYREGGDLVAYGSHHCAQRSKLKSIAWSAIRALPPGSHLYIEGGGELLEVWLKVARRQSIPYVTLSAERWRSDTFIPRDQRSAKVAKQKAVERARELIIERSDRAPTHLRHDAAEAILMGWWALSDQGWLS